MKKLIILIGAPCAGKSTWSKNYVGKYPNTVRFNRDDIRLMLQGKLTLDNPSEEIVTSMIHEGMDTAVSLGKDIIVDQTNCKLKYIKGLIDMVKNNPEIIIKLKIIHQPLELLLERNIERSRVMKTPLIPEHIIKNMYNNLNEMINSKEFKELTSKYEYLV